AQADAPDAHSVVAKVDPGTERLDGARGGERVLGAAEAAHDRLAVRERAEQERTVRDRLVAGHGERAAQRRDRPNPHWSVMTGDTTTPEPCASSRSAAPAAAASPVASTVRAPPRPRQHCRPP